MITFSHALAGILTTLGLALLIVVTKGWHGKLSLDSGHGIQKHHAAPTPRVGGVAILGGLLVSWFMAEEGVKQLLGQLLLAGSFAFAFGFIEDLTKRVSVLKRLLATVASGIAACVLTGYSISTVGVWGADYLLAIGWFSVIFTAFAVGGVANSINIIDGFNGLAAGVVMISMAALAAIAHDVGDMAFAYTCWTIIAVIAGFLLVNFPFGKIFLGDGGAYLLGFLLAFLAVLLPARNPQVSDWASFLACSYPIIETLFSMTRRHFRDQHVGHPDRLHLHSLVKYRFINKLFVGGDPTLRNSAVSPVVWVFASVPAGLAALLYDDKVSLIVAALGCILAYGLTYRRFAYFRFTYGRGLRIKRQFKGSAPL
jgi:UDP-N-acetylmuramyl pentapeptide phosphotransferase/UDP-N-acetylglucosamine-1-phosphate transferase